jgi:hypothetical protein
VNFKSEVVVAASAVGNVVAICSTSNNVEVERTTTTTTTNKQTNKQTNKLYQRKEGEGALGLLCFFVVLK